MYNKYCFLKIKLNDNVSCFIYQFSSYTIILSHSLHSLPFPSYSTILSYSLSYTIILSIPFTLYPSLIFFFIHYHSLHSPYLLFLFLCWIVRYDWDFLGFPKDWWSARECSGVLWSAREYSGVLRGA